MIAVDTSALMAILLNEPEGDACSAALVAADRVLISAGTLAEALIVANQRGVGSQMEQLVSELDIEVVAVTAEFSRVVALAYGIWGKGNHPAGLNFGDCFAYVLAGSKRCPLLYVGADFAATKITSAL